jgi:hypothetical protein
MASTITHSCPVCHRVFATTSNWSLGAPVIQCSKCGTMIKTGWHKHAKFGDYFGAILLFILSFFLLGCGIYAYMNDTPIVLVIMLIIFILFILLGIRQIIDIKKYENSAEAKSDQIPTR